MSDSDDEKLSKEEREAKEQTERLKEQEEQAGQQLLTIFSRSSYPNHVSLLLYSSSLQMAATTWRC